MSIFLLFSFFNLISILIPSYSSFCFITYFCLSLPSCASLFASSLFTPPLILPKTKIWDELLIFCTLGATKQEWKKRKCKRWNGRKGPTFILGGLIELFLKTITLFAECGIGYWIPIWVAHYTFSLDFENALLLKTWHWFNDVFFVFFFLGLKNVLLSKCGISWLRPFSHSFSMDIVSMIK